MKYKVKKVQVIEESNEIGNIFIEMLIERMLLQELKLPTSLQVIILSKKYKKKDDYHGSKKDKEE